MYLGITREGTECRHKVEGKNGVFDFPDPPRGKSYFLETREFIEKKISSAFYCPDIVGKKKSGTSSIQN